MSSLNCLLLSLHCGTDKLGTETIISICALYKLTLILHRGCLLLP